MATERELYSTFILLSIKGIIQKNLHDSLELPSVRPVHTF